MITKFSQTTIGVLIGVLLLAMLGFCATTDDRELGDIEPLLQELAAFEAIGGDPTPFPNESPLKFGALRQIAKRQSWRTYLLAENDEPELALPSILPKASANRFAKRIDAISAKVLAGNSGEAQALAAEFEKPTSGLRLRNSGDRLLASTLLPSLTTFYTAYTKSDEIREAYPSASPRAAAPGDSTPLAIATPVRKSPVILRRQRLARAKGPAPYQPRAPPWDIRRINPFEP